MPATDYRPARSSEPKACSACRDLNRPWRENITQKAPRKRGSESTKVSSKKAAPLTSHRQQLMPASRCEIACIR